MANEVRIVVNAEDHASESIKGISTSAIAMGTAIGGIATQAATKLADLGKDAFMVGVNFNAMKEQANVAFTQMLGSATEARAFLEELQNFAARTPFEFPDLVRSAQRLKAMGFAAAEVIPIMTDIGNATSAMGAGPEVINRVVIAFGQIQSRGKAAAQEMMQLTEAGIPAWQYLADAIGKSVPEAMQEVQYGFISAEVTLAAVRAGMQRDFGGMMDVQSKTFNGLISTLKDNMRIMLGELTGPMFAEMKTSLVQLSSWFEEHKEQVKRVIGAISDTVADWVRGFRDIAEVYIAIWSKVAGFIADHKSAIIASIVAIGTALTLVFGPVGAAAVALAVFPTLLGKLRDEWNGTANSVIGSVEGMVNGLIHGINAMIDKLGDFFEMIRRIPGGAKAFELMTGVRLPEGQIFSSVIGDVTIGRIAGKGIFTDVEDDFFRMGQTAKKTTATTQELTSSEGKLSDTRESARKEIDRVTQYFQSEQIKAYINGGQSALDAVRSSQEEMRKKITSIADDLVQVFGLDVPEAMNIALNSVTDSMKKMDDMAEKQRKAFDDARAALIGSMSGDAARQDFESAAANGLRLYRDAMGSQGYYRPGTEPAGYSELFNPSTAFGGAQAPEGGAGMTVAPVTININGIVTDPVATGQAVADALNAAATQSGPVLLSGVVQ